MRQFVLVLLIAAVFTEEVHDHNHEDEVHGGESLVNQCLEQGGRYCFDPKKTDGDHCYLPDHHDDYCRCTDTDDVTVNPGPADVIWNDETKSCESNTREQCELYKENLRAFYKGTCHSEKTCEAANLIWKDGVHAKCAHAQAWCAVLDEVTWHEDDSECECNDPAASYHTDHCHVPTKPVTNSQKWGYGIIATAVISLFAVFGVFVVFFRERWWYQLLLSTMVALAMGCLLSDATLHLIPLALGLHSHEEEGEEHEDHGHEEEKMSPSERRNITVAITLGVYIFFLFEKMIHLVLPHQHSHGGEPEIHTNPANGTELKDIENGNTKAIINVSTQKETGGLAPVENVDYNEEGMKNSKPACHERRSIVNHLHTEDVITKDGGICNVDSVAWMIIIGDALHNFADGLVMGAAFTNSLATGLGTTLAVFCHEVPHELGDFAVLLNAGMKVKFAVLFNFLSACTCFLGLFVGLAIGENEGAQKWIFAFTAGMFIYIACSDLIPLMNEQQRTAEYPKSTLVLQQFGIIVGFLIIFVLSLTEG